MKILNPAYLGTCFAKPATVLEDATYHLDKVYFLEVNMVAVLVHRPVNVEGRSVFVITCCVNISVGVGRIAILHPVGSIARLVDGVVGQFATAECQCLALFP